MLSFLRQLDKHISFCLLYKFGAQKQQLIRANHPTIIASSICSWILFASFDLDYFFTSAALFFILQTNLRAFSPSKRNPNLSKRPFSHLLNNNSPPGPPTLLQRILHFPDHVTQQPKTAPPVPALLSTGTTALEMRTGAAHPEDLGLPVLGDKADVQSQRHSPHEDNA